MRITQNYSIQSLLRQVNNTRERINILQRNLATGKRINQISDDPANIESVLRYQEMLKINQRYEENINNVVEFLTFTSNALNDSADIIAKVKELAIQGVDSNGADEFQAIVEQVDELLQKLVDVANTRFKGRYVFGGANVSTAPFTISADLSTVTANPQGIDGKLKVEITHGRRDTYNITGQEAFLKNNNIFKVIIDLRDALVNQDIPAIQNSLPELDSSLDQVLEANTKVGAKINRYELLLFQYQDEDIRLQEFLSEIEDTDIARTVVDLQGEQTALETALKTLAQTVNISLVNFI